MHNLARIIEIDGKFVMLCPSCDFGFDLVEWYRDAQTEEGKVAFVDRWRREPVNTEQADRS